MSSPTFSCDIYVSELESAWLKRFVDTLASADDDDLVDDHRWETPMGEAARELCGRLGERAIDLDFYAKLNVPSYDPDGRDRIVVSFLEPASGRRTSGPRLVAETLMIFLQQMRSTEAKPTRYEIAWTNDDHVIPAAGILLASRHAIVEVDLDTLHDLAHERLDTLHELADRRLDRARTGT